MKSKIVIEVQMPSDKYRSKAMKIAASTYGVESVALKEDDRNRLVVTGEFVDSVNLTKTLRKKIGRAVIVEQSEVKKKDDKKKEEEIKILWQPQPGVLVYDPLESNPNPCSII